MPNLLARALPCSLVTSRSSFRSDLVATRILHTFSAELASICLTQVLTFSKDLGSLQAQAKSIPSAPLQQVWVMLRNRSWPAVSQTWSLMRLSWSCMILILKSTPMVATQLSLKTPSVKQVRRLVLPTPLSPTTMILKCMSQAVWCLPPFMLHSAAIQIQLLLFIDDCMDGQAKSSFKSRFNPLHQPPTLPQHPSQPSHLSKDALESRYQQALTLMQDQSEGSLLEALTILQGLSQTIKALPAKHTIDHKLLQNIVINAWRVMSQLKGKQFKKQQPLIFIRQFAAHFKQYYHTRQNHKNGLALLYLIQANEEYEQKLLDDAVKSCELSIQCCQGVKNEPHLLKVEFLKSKVFADLGQREAQMKAIRKCLHFANLLVATVGDEGLKEYIRTIKISLEERKDILRRPAFESQDHKKSRRMSGTKFRKRSVSLKKQQSEKEIKVVEKTPSASRLARYTLYDPKSLHHHKSSGHTKHNSLKNEDRKDFLPLDIRKYQKENKLKKKPLQLKPQQHTFTQARNDIMDDIEFEAPKPFNHADLLLDRPKSKKKDTTIRDQSKKAITDKDSALSQEQIEEEEGQAEEEMIEPVTHQGSAKQREDPAEHEEHEVIQECARKAEESLFKNYIKLQKHLNSSDNAGSNVNITLNRIQEEGSFHAFDFDLSERHDSDLIIGSHPSLDTDSFYDNSFVKIGEKEGVAFHGGTLTQFNFHLKIQKNDLKSSQGLFRVLSISFMCTVNRQSVVKVTLRYPFFHVQQEQIEPAITEVFSKEVGNQQKDLDISLKQKIFGLIINQVRLQRRQVGTVLTPKERNYQGSHSLIERHQKQLKNRLLVYQLNQITQSDKEPNYIWEEQQIFIPRRQVNEPTQVLELNNIYKLRSRKSSQTRQARHSCQSQSQPVSKKRLKTEKLRKQTLLSFKSTVRSMFSDSDLNGKLTFEESKSLSLAIMPSDFGSKIVNYFESLEDITPTSGPEFYYCMKFIMIKPPNTQKNGTLESFYDSIDIEQLHSIQQKSVLIKMTAYRTKELYKKTSQTFYKFDLQFKGEKMKMMKFIATSQDLLVMNRTSVKQKKGERTVKSVKSKYKAIKEEDQVSRGGAFSREELSKLLCDIAPHIFIKKDYIYNIIGVEGKDEYFSFINKFRLEGKTVQGRHFMIPHLKHLHVLLQKTIRINCQLLREHAVLTVEYFEKRPQFSLIFYLPRLQRTYSINLPRTIIPQVVAKKELNHIQKVWAVNIENIENYCFQSFKGGKERKVQHELWNSFTRLFRFETQPCGQTLQILLKIESFSAFLKDLSFSEYIELNHNFFHLEISVARRAPLITPNQKMPPSAHRQRHLSKRKSSSSKELQRVSSQSVNKKQDSFRKQRPLRPPSRRITNQPSGPFLKKTQLFTKLDQIYETDTSKYIIYISLTQLNHQKDGNATSEEKKVNYSFYLSDLVGLLRHAKGEMESEEAPDRDFAEEIFSFAVLLRSMTVIKYKLISELKKVNIEELFGGQSRITRQKEFKNNLNAAFISSNDNLYSLNTSKALHRHENNIFMLNKRIISMRKGLLVSIFLDKKSRLITFILSNNHELTNRQKSMRVADMFFPWIEFYSKEHLVTINNRLFLYYKNLLLMM